MSSSGRASKARLGLGLEQARVVSRASLGRAGGTSFDFAQDRLYPYVQSKTL
jgi:hypothetical protein